MQQGYTGPEVCKITGISYRQLDHWTSTKLIDASIRNIKGSGKNGVILKEDLMNLMGSKPQPSDTRNREVDL